MVEQTYRKSSIAQIKRSTVNRWQLPGLDQVIHHQPGQEWAPHWHNEWSIGVITEGTCYCQVGGHPWVLPQGTILRIPPGTVHTGALLPQSDSNAVNVLMWYVPSEWLKERNIEWCEDSRFFCSDKLVSEAKNVCDYHMFLKWLISLQSEFDNAKSHRQAAISQRAKDILEKLQSLVIDGQTNVTEAAAVCGISREMLHRQLKKWTGMPPEQYFRTVKLNRARELLLEGLPICDVSEECGFADQAHFSRWFKRCFGFSPGDLLKQVHQSD